jgi:hypothetical protein
MIPTLNDLTANDNSAALKASAESEQISILYKRLAQDQRDISASLNKTMSRIMNRHNAHDSTPASLDNDNIRESYVRPKENANKAINSTLDKMIDKFTPEEDGVKLYSWENDNQQDFYTLSRRNPTDDDHNETLDRIMAQQASAKEEASREEVTPIAYKNHEESEHSILKGIENGTTNILDILKQINSSVGDMDEKLSLNLEKLQASHEKVANSLTGSESGASNPFLAALKQEKEDEDADAQEKKQKDGGLRSVLKGITAGVVATVGGVTGSAVGSLLPHNAAEPGGGYDGSQQAPEQKSSSLARRGGRIPVEQISRSRQNMEISLFKAFKKQGYTDEGSKTMVAEVGRENGFREDLIFGTHIDPGNKALNEGIISWQGSRREKLQEFLKSRGLLDKNGRMIHSQATIDAQAEFLANEMKQNKSMRRADTILRDPTKKYGNIEAEVGDHVVQWRRTDPKYSASGYRNQNEAYSEVSELLKKPNTRGQMLNQQSAQNTAKGNVVVVQNNNTTNVSSSQKSNPQPSKPKILAARSPEWWQPSYWF